MKKKIEKTLTRLGYKFNYIPNVDDIHSDSYEFNPFSRVMIQIAFKKRKNPKRCLIYIKKYIISTRPDKIYYHQIIGGRAILTKSGKIDYSFYESILKNSMKFI